MGRQKQITEICIIAECLSAQLFRIKCQALAQICQNPPPAYRQEHTEVRMPILVILHMPSCQ